MENESYGIIDTAVVLRKLCCQFSNASQDSQLDDSSFTSYCFVCNLNFPRAVPSYSFSRNTEEGDQNKKILKVKSKYAWNCVVNFASLRFINIEEPCNYLFISSTSI